MTFLLFVSNVFILFAISPSSTLVAAYDSSSSSSSSSSSTSSFSSFSTTNSNNNDNDWGLHYHHSPWLEKDFLQLVDSDAPPFQSPSSGDTSTTTTTADGSSTSAIKCSEEGTDDEDVSCSCRRGKRGYRPSMHCISRWSKQQRWKKWPTDTNIVDDAYEDSPDVDTLIERAQEKRREKLTEADLSILSEKGKKNWPPFGRCDYLTERTVDEMCHADRKGIRAQLLRSLTLRSCRRFAVDKALSPELYRAVVNNTDCGRILRELLVLDDLVEKLACEFEAILMRYDCAAEWSMWRCEDCQMAYRDWICSTLIPYYLFTGDQHEKVTKPCQSICEQVEQKCPHLHPYGKGQYAGEPVFLCIDANIPFNEQITPNTPYGEPGKCYNLCDLEKCQNDAGEKPTLTCWQEEIDAAVAAATAAASTTTTSTFSSTSFNQTNSEGEFTTSTSNSVTISSATTEGTGSIGNAGPAVPFPTVSTDDQQTTTTTSVVSGAHDEEHNGSKGHIELETLTTKPNSGVDDQLTTIPSYGAWNAEDEAAYYQILQASGSDRRNQKMLSSSGRLQQQYLEIESNYLNEGGMIKGGGGKDLLDSMDASAYDVTENTGNGALASSSSYQASLQEIYREAMAVTTVDSMMAAGNGVDPLNEIELPEEDIAEEWIHASDVAASSANHQQQQQIQNQQQQPTTSSSSSSSTSAMPPFEPFLEQLTATPPTESESDNIVRNHDRNHFKVTSTTTSTTTRNPTYPSTSATTTSKASSLTDNRSLETSQLSSSGKVDGGVNGRQFRHHNSRNKQQQQIDQQTGAKSGAASSSNEQHWEKSGKSHKQQLLQQKKTENFRQKPQPQLRQQQQQKPKQLSPVSIFSFQTPSKVITLNANENKLTMGDILAVITSSSVSNFQFQFQFLLISLFSVLGIIL